MQQPSSTIINFDYALCAFLVVVTCGWMPGITQNGLQMLILDYGAMVLFALSFSSLPKRESNNKGIIAVVLACILVALFNNFQAFSINIIHVFSGCLLYCAIVRSSSKSTLIAKTLIAIAAVNIFIFLLQKIGFDPIYIVDPINKAIQAKHLSSPGLMGRNYHLAFFLVALIPMAFFIGRKIACIYSLIAILITLLIGSQASFIALAIVILAEAVYSYSKVLRITQGAILNISFFGLLILMFFLPFVWYKICLRWEVYSYILRESLMNPFMGHGLGSFDQAIKLGSAEPLFDSSFNQALKFVYELGAAPFLVVSWIIVKYFKTIFYKKATPFLIAILALSSIMMFHELLRFAKFIALMVTFCALYEVQCINKGETNAR